MERLGDYTRALARREAGLSFTRHVRAVAVESAKRGGAASFAERWYDTPRVANALGANGGHRVTQELIDIVLRGGVNPGSPDDAEYAAALAQYKPTSSEFCALLRPMTIIGKLSARRVPFDVSYPRQQSDGAAVSWVGVGAPAPMSAIAFDTNRLGHAKCAAIIAISSELAESAKPQADELLRNELLAAVAQFLDEQFIDPGVVAVANVSPGSITNGIVPVQSSGSTAAAIYSDLGTLLSAAARNNLNGDSLRFILSSIDGALLAAKTDSTGSPAFPNITAFGGTLCGVPAITSNSVPSSVSGGSLIALVDTRLIDIGDEDLILADSADQASLQMVTNPQTGEQQLVSLFQNGLVATRITAWKNWQRVRDEAVMYLDGCHFG